MRARCTGFIASAGVTALVCLVWAAPTIASPPPNVLVVMTDDQPYGSVEKMPFLASQPDFVRFERAFTNHPLCCPARATFQSGLYSHHTGVIGYDTGSRFDASHSLATVFDATGYETGLFGKYMNGYPFGRGDDYVPKGYDAWVAFLEKKAGYYDYALTVNGTTEAHGDSAADYSTDVLAAHTNAFIRSANSPFFAVFAPKGAHAPYTPAPRHEHVYDDAHVELPANFNQVDDEAHKFFRELPPVDRRDARSVVRSQWETLLSVDEAIATFYATLVERGELDDTIVVLISDNGYSLGSHRWVLKRCLFDECAHVPLLIRGPGIAPGTEDALVSNVDLPTTLAELAGLDLGPTDGLSLVPLLSDDAETLGRPVLLRNVNRRKKHPPAAWGIRTSRWKYVEYAHERDLFQLAKDPGEIRDLAARERYTGVRKRLARELDELRQAEPR